MTGADSSMTDQDRREALANDAAWQSGYARGRADCARDLEELRAALTKFEADYLRIRNEEPDPAKAWGALDAWTWGFLQERPVRAALHHKDGAS